MGRLTAYANTSVSLFKTQDDLERLLLRHGISASRWTHFAEADMHPGLVRFEFEWLTPNGARLGFRVDIGYQYEPGPRGGNQGTTREQAGRALYWHIKNLLEAVTFGIVDLEQAFLPYLLTASGQTVYDEAKSRIEALTSGDVAGLLERPRPPG